MHTKNTQPKKTLTHTKHKNSSCDLVIFIYVIAPFFFHSLLFSNTKLKNAGVRQINQ